MTIPRLSRTRARSYRYTAEGIIAPEETGVVLRRSRPILITHEDLLAYPSDSPILVPAAGEALMLLFSQAILIPQITTPYSGVDDDARFYISNGAGSILSTAAVNDVASNTTAVDDLLDGVSAMHLTPFTQSINNDTEVAGGELDLATLANRPLTLAMTNGAAMTGGAAGQSIVGVIVYDVLNIETGLFV